MKYSAYYLGFPATFHVISRKIDYLWDSEENGSITIVTTKIFIFTQRIFGNIVKFEI